MSRKLVGALFFAAVLGTVVLANWLVATYGVVPVGFGLMAPAAVYAVALALVCRDVLQNCWGRAASIVAIACGALLSLLVSPHFAIASAVAFACSETVDFAIYTALYRRGWVRAVIPAGIAAAVIDSLVFLWLAFGSEAFFFGQLLGKTWGVLAGALLLLPLRRVYAVRPA